MRSQNFVLSKLEGYSGVRLKGNKQLVFRPGINLLVGRNGCGKTNLLRLIQQIATDKTDVSGRIESKYFFKHLRTCLNKKKVSIEKQFGEPTIVEHTIKGKRGAIKLHLKNVPEEHVARNLMQNGSSFQNNIGVTIKTEPVTFRQINSSQSPPKFEMSGFVSAKVLSQEHNNQVHSMLADPINAVSDFINTRMTEFFESEEFIGRIKELEKLDK